LQHWLYVFADEHPGSSPVQAYPFCGPTDIMARKISPRSACNVLNELVKTIQTVQNVQGLET